MLKVRLQRVGRRNSPSYRIVTTDSRTGPKSGRHIDILGSYNPKTGDVVLNEEKIRERLAHGAQASGTVHNMLVSKKIIDGKKVNVLPKKSPIAKESAEEVANEAPTAGVTEAAPEEGSNEAPPEAQPAPAEVAPAGEATSADAADTGSVAVDEAPADAAKAAPAEQDAPAEPDAEASAEATEEEKPA